MTVINPEDAQAIKESIKKDNSNTQRRSTHTEQPTARSGSRVQRSMKRNQVGEAVAEFTAAMGKLISDSPQEFDFKVVPMDGSTYSLHYSIVVLLATTKIGSKAVCAAYALILEGSNIRPAAAPQQVGRSGSIEVILTAMDAWEEGTFNKIIDAATAATGIEEVISAGACVVPASVDYKDEHRVHQIVWNANEAIHSTLETQYPESFPHISISEYIAPTDRINVSAEFNLGNAEQVTGIPVRSDINFRMSVSGSNGDNNVFTDWQHRGTRELMELSAFVNPVFTGVAAPAAYGQPQPTQMFIPQVVVTQVQANDMPFTPETFFLALSTIALLGDNFQWAQQFTNFGRGDMHDIGGIGLRVQQVLNPREQPVPLETNTNAFGEQQLSDLVREFFEPHPVFCIDAEDAGPDSWMTGIMVEAANGNQVANNWIIAAIDRLTDNNFSRFYDGGPLFENVGVRIHLGTFKQDGQVRDLRELDSTAWLNLIGHTDMGLVEEWEATFNNEGIPQELRLAQRMDMLRAQLGETNVHVHGMADRLVISNSLLSALVDSVVAAGLVIDQQGLRPFYGDSHQIGNQSLRGRNFGGTGANMVRARNNQRSVAGRTQFSPFSRR
jgi:hypothetical protein